MVDTRDLKSLAYGMWVRVPQGAPETGVDMLPSDEMLKKYNNLFESVPENFWEDLVVEIERKRIEITNQKLVASFVFLNSLKGYDFWCSVYLQSLRGRKNGR